MGKFVNFLERKIGKYAIPRLPMYILICYAIGYLMSFINPQIAYVLSLNPYAILHGQVWRLVTWVLIPPPEGNLFFVLIMLYFYYSLGMTLERTWGTFYFNYYIFSGMLFTILGAFCMYGYVMRKKCRLPINKHMDRNFRLCTGEIITMQFCPPCFQLIM